VLTQLRLGRSRLTVPRESGEADETAPRNFPAAPVHLRVY